MPSGYSVVVPSRAEEPWLEAALVSVQRQTLPPKRIIVVVNGPGAEAGAMGSSLAGASGVQVEMLSTAGQARAIAHGISLVTTPFVAFIDTDDLWTSTKQERQIASLEAASDLDAVAGLTRNFTVNVRNEVCLAEAKAGRLFGATCFRTEAFRRFGLPDATTEQFVWQYRWWLNTARMGIKVSMEEMVVLERRIHDANGWVTDRDLGKQQLLTELRKSVQRSRETR